MTNPSNLAIKTATNGKIVVTSIKTTYEKVIELAGSCLAELQKTMFDDEEFSLTILNSKSADIRRFYAVRARSANVDIVLKINFYGKNSSRFERESQTQKRISEQYRGFDNLSVPQVLYISQQQPFFVMRYAKGTGIYAALRDHVLVEDEDRVFHLAGQWLAKTHGLRALENVAFSPLNAQRNLDTRLQSRETAKNGTYLADQFDVHYQKLLKMSADFEGRDNPVVLGHGDFHGDNLVFSNSGVTGLDFYNVRRLSAGLDIARFLVHADLSQFETPEKIGPLGLVTSHINAFFDGYGMELDAGHVFNYFIRLRLLETWSKFPAKISSTHLSQSALDLMVQRVGLAFQG